MRMSVDLPARGRELSDCDAASLRATFMARASGPGPASRAKGAGPRLAMWVAVVVFPGDPSRP